MQTQICGKITMLVNKVTLKKSAKKQKHIKLKNLKAYFFANYFLTHQAMFPQIQFGETRHYFTLEVIPFNRKYKQIFHATGVGSYPCKVCSNAKKNEFFALHTK